MNIVAATIKLAGSYTTMEITTDLGTVRVDDTSLKARILAACAVLTGPAIDDGSFPVETMTIPAMHTGESEIVIRNATTEPQIVEMARRWALGEIDGLGAVDVPSFEEADAADWRLMGGELVRV